MRDQPFELALRQRRPTGKEDDQVRLGCTRHSRIASNHPMDAVTAEGNERYPDAAPAVPRRSPRLRESPSQAVRTVVEQEEQ